MKRKLTRPDAVFLIALYEVVIENRASNAVVQEALGTWGFEQLDAAITALRDEFEIPDENDD